VTADPVNVLFVAVAFTRYDPRGHVLATFTLFLTIPVLLVLPDIFWTVPSGFDIVSVTTALAAGRPFSCTFA